MDLDVNSIKMEGNGNRNIPNICVTQWLAHCPGHRTWCARSCLVQNCPLHPRPSCGRVLRINSLLPSPPSPQMCEQQSHWQRGVKLISFDNTSTAQEVRELKQRLAIICHLVNNSEGAVIQGGGGDSSFPGQTKDVAEPVRICNEGGLPFYLAEPIEPKSQLWEWYSLNLPSHCPPLVSSSPLMQLIAAIFFHHCCNEAWQQTLKWYSLGKNLSLNSNDLHHSSSKVWSMMLFTAACFSWQRWC